MQTFMVTVDVFVIASLVYISFVLTLGEYLAALRRGRAVSLLPERNGRKYPFWAQVSLLALGMVICTAMFYFLWIPLFPISTHLALVLKLVGLILYISGFAFVLWARRALGRLWGISTSRQVRLLDDHSIVQSGPYAFVRNPMYFGWWVAMTGLTLLYPVWVVLLLLVFSVLAFSGRARREDAVLLERFGEAWNDYKHRTKFLIPFIY